MSLKEQTYSVLVVSSAENFNAALPTLFSESTYTPIRVVTNTGAAKRAIAERSYDFVLINAPLPDEFGTRFAIDACESKNTVVLMLVRSDIYEPIYNKVTEYGVFTLVKPITKSVFAQCLSWMISARERLRRFEKKSVSLEERMEEIRLINRAKWALINELKMSEPDAHHYIEKQAMDSGTTRREIAQDIIRMYG